MEIAVETAFSRPGPLTSCVAREIHAGESDFRGGERYRPTHRSADSTVAPPAQRSAERGASRSEARFTYGGATFTSRAQKLDAVH